MDKLLNLSYNYDNTPMQDTLSRQLAEVGLNEHEASVYVALVGHSPASASFIARKLGLSRSTVYTALERLIGKGLVGTSFRNEVKQFVAQPSSAVAEMLREEERQVRTRLERFEGIAEQLKVLAKGDAAVPRIVFFEGKESLKKIYMGMLRDAEPHSTMRVLRDEFVWGKDWSFVFEDEWNRRVRRLRAEHDVRTRLLINDSDLERKHERYYGSRKHLERRRLPSKHRIEDFVIYVLGETASILSMERGNLVGIRITNRLIAANFERLFDALWDIAKK